MLPCAVQVPESTNVFANRYGLRTLNAPGFASPLLTETWFGPRETLVSFSNLFGSPWKAYGRARVRSRDPRDLLETPPEIIHGGYRTAYFRTAVCLTAVGCQAGVPSSH
jgi:hypothetical protein